MKRHILMLATSAFILACGGTAATAQQGPMMQQQPQDQNARNAQNRRLAGQQGRQRPQGNPLAARNGQVPQLNGIAQVVGLALGSPEFQRH